MGKDGMGIKQEMPSPKTPNSSETSDSDIEIIPYTKPPPLMVDLIDSDEERVIPPPPPPEPEEEIPPKKKKKKKSRHNDDHSRRRADRSLRGLFSPDAVIPSTSQEKSPDKRTPRRRKRRNKDRDSSTSTSTTTSPEKRCDRNNGISDSPRVPRTSSVSRDRVSPSSLSGAVNVPVTPPAANDTQQHNINTSSAGHLGQLDSFSNGTDCNLAQPSISKFLDSLGVPTEVRLPARKRGRPPRVQVSPLATPRPIPANVNYQDSIEAAVQFGASLSESESELANVTAPPADAPIVREVNQSTTSAITTPGTVPISNVTSLEPREQPRDSVTVSTSVPTPPVLNISNRTEPMSISTSNSSTSKVTSADSQQVQLESNTTRQENQEMEIQPLRNTNTNSSEREHGSPIGSFVRINSATATATGASTSASKQPRSTVQPSISTNTENINVFTTKELENTSTNLRLNVNVSSRLLENVGVSKEPVRSSPNSPNVSSPNRTNVTAVIPRTPPGSTTSSPLRHRQSHHKENSTKDVDRTNDHGRRREGRPYDRVITISDGEDDGRKRKHSNSSSSDNSRSSKRRKTSDHSDAEIAVVLKKYEQNFDDAILQKYITNRPSYLPSKWSPRLCAIYDQKYTTEDKYRHINARSDIPVDKPDRPSRFANVRCKNPLCREMGHTQDRCPRKNIKDIVCHMCRGVGHGVVGHNVTVGGRCPMAMCLNCGTKTNNNKFVNHCDHCPIDKCGICKSRGHLEHNCPDHWRRYYSTTELVDNKAYRTYDKTDYHKTKTVYCCVCAQKGHNHSTCPKYVAGGYYPQVPYVLQKLSKYDPPMESHDSRTDHSKSQQQTQSDSTPGTSRQANPVPPLQPNSLSKEYNSSIVTEQTEKTGHRRRSSSIDHAETPTSNDSSSEFNFTTSGKKGPFFRPGVRCFSKRVRFPLVFEVEPTVSTSTSTTNIQIREVKDNTPSESNNVEQSPRCTNFEKVDEKPQEKQPKSRTEEEGIEVITIDDDSDDDQAVPSTSNVVPSTTAHPTSSTSPATTSSTTRIPIPATTSTTTWIPIPATTSTTTRTPIPATTSTTTTSSFTTTSNANANQRNPQQRATGITNTATNGSTTTNTNNRSSTSDTRNDRRGANRNIQSRWNAPYAPLTSRPHRPSNNPRPRPPNNLFANRHGHANRPRGAGPGGRNPFNNNNNNNNNYNNQHRPFGQQTQAPFRPYYGATTGYNYNQPIPIPPLMNNFGPRPYNLLSFHNSNNNNMNDANVFDYDHVNRWPTNNNSRSFNDSGQTFRPPSIQQRFGQSQNFYED